MNTYNYWPSQTTLYRDNYKSDKEYRQAYQEHCQHYGYKIRVTGGWRFFEFSTDYETAKNQK